MGTMDSKYTFRARFILWCIIITAIVLSISLYLTQIVRGDQYADQADRQYGTSVRQLFDRGSILLTSKDGEHPAVASLVVTFEVSMSPRTLIDPEGAYDALSHYIDIDQADFMRKASLEGDPYEEIAGKVDEHTAQSIKDLNLVGISVTKETRRSYPGGGLASHVVGLVGEGSNRLPEGKYGLERSYDNILARTPNHTRSIFTQIFTSDKYSLDIQSNSGDIVISIEPTVQSYLENTLDAIQEIWNPDEIGGIIIEPSTGEIIAAASDPDFDPNNLTGLSNPSVLSNPLVENVYEMGSIMKPLTVAVGLDTGVINANSVYDDTGTMTLDGRKISNYDGRARGEVEIQEILSQSLNVGAATVALKVGAEEFTRYFRSFGLAEKTGIDQPNEATGLTRNLDSARDIEIATAAYGQGIAMSPMAITRALSVLANDGKLITPHFATEIDYTDGRKETIEYPQSYRVLQPESINTVTRMLVTVVDEALRNGNIKIDGYSVAAKTGTAQIPDPLNKKYYDDRYLHSFFGYFPAYNPRFLVFLYQKYPKGAQYASETLSEPFHDLTKFLIGYYNIPPDR